MLQHQQKNNKKKHKKKTATKTIKKWEIKNTFLSHFVNLDAKQIACLACTLHLLGCLHCPVSYYFFKSAMCATPTTVTPLRAQRL